MPQHQITDFYIPLAKQDEYHQSTAPYRLHVGGFGSGKTLNGLMEAIITCLLVPGCSCLILRTTSPDIQNTVIRKFLDEKFVPRWVYKSYNKNEKIAYFENGSQLRFGYCQRDEDVMQYLSTEYAYIHLEEAGEFSYRIFEVLVGRARLSTEVKDLYGNAVKTSIGLTTNPFGNGWGWISTLFGTAKKPKGPVKGMGRYDPSDYFRVHSTVKDNPYIYTPEYVKKLESMTGTLREQALYGNEDVVGGQMYPQFNTGQHEGVHVMEPNQIRFRSYEPIWCGSDWDSKNWPVLWLTKGWIPDKIHGGLRQVTVAFRELVLENMNPVQAADAIARACRHQCTHNDCGDVCENPAHAIKRVTEPLKRFFFSWDRFIRHENNHTVAQSLGDRLAKYGLPRPQAADKSRVDGWSLIGQMFDLDELVVTTDCPQLIAALPTLIRDTPNDPEDVKKIASVEDDLADSFRYAVKSYLPGGKKPQALADAEALDRILDPVAQKIRAYEQWVKRNQGPKTYQDSRALPWMVRK
jgi:hypothetical protein